MADNLRTGYTTGTCASAAAKAATMLLLGEAPPDEVEIALPDGANVTFPVAKTKIRTGSAQAGIVKDAGDDPDVTDGVTVYAEVSWAIGSETVYAAGEGVGTVTKKGLSVPPGEPAINPVPRKMILDAIKSVTDKPVKITVSIPGGSDLAKKTFNPKLGIVDGLSILGTSGIVRPYSCPALKASLKCILDVASGNGVENPVFTAGNIGTRAAFGHFNLKKEQVIEIGNEWGFMLDLAAKSKFKNILAIGHPGKLAKLAVGDWDTHSSRSKSALPVVNKIALELFGEKPQESPTVEGIFESLSKTEKMALGNELSKRINESITARIGKSIKSAVAIVNMRGELIGTFENIETWR